jgi:hypothetical protein
MRASKTHTQETPSQLESKTATQSDDTTQPIKLRRQRNGQYTGSLLG